MNKLNNKEDLNCTNSIQSQRIDDEKNLESENEENEIINDSTKDDEAKNMKVVDTMKKRHIKKEQRMEKIKIFKYNFFLSI